MRVGKKDSVAAVALHSRSGTNSFGFSRAYSAVIYGAERLYTVYRATFAGDRRTRCGDVYDVACRCFRYGFLRGHAQLFGVAGKHVTAVNLPPMDSPRALDTRPVVSAVLRCALVPLFFFFLFSGSFNLLRPSLRNSLAAGGRCGSLNVILIARRAPGRCSITAGP